MKALALALLLAAAGCGSASDTPLGRDFDTHTDAAGDVLAPPTTTTGTAGKAGAGGGAGTGGAGGAGGVTGGGAGAGSGGAAGAPGSAGAGGSGTAGAAGSTTPIDAGSSTPDATAPEASAPDAGGVDGAPPSTDARAGDVGDAAADPICPDISKPRCQSVNKTDDQIRATFTQPCNPEGQHKCGGLYSPTDMITETLPMLCRNGSWRLGGSWSGSQWVPAYECSKGCAAGKLCDP